MSREEYLLRREEYRRRVAAHEALPNSLRPTAEQAPQSSVGSADDPA
jgi:hypothetical protein